MIEEILEALKSHDKVFTETGIKEYPLTLSIEEQKVLLDYITNLQEKYNGIKSNFDIQLEYDKELENKITNLQKNKQSIIYNIKIKSWWDTLLVWWNRNYFTRWEVWVMKDLMKKYLHSL